MRTHLLRTFYPPSAIEPDTGRAANDNDLGGSDISIAERPVAIGTVYKIAEERDGGDNDDYFLGGYAGI